MQNPVNVNLKDGGLGVGMNGIDGLHVKIGVAESGTAEKLYSITNDKEPGIKLGGGPLVDSLVRHFDEKGIRCYALRPENDQEGSIGFVTKSRDEAPVLTAEGTPTASRQFKLEIIVPGANEAATYRWSDDNGITWSSEYTTPATAAAIEFSAGVSVKLAAGNFVTGDLYSFASVAPTASAAKFLSAIDKVKEQFNPDSAPYRFIHIVGGFERSFWESVEAKLSDFEDARIFTFFILEYPEKTTGTELEYFQKIIDEGKLFQSKRVAIVGSRQRYGLDDDYKSTAIMLCSNLSTGRTNIHPGWVAEYPSKTSKEIQFWDTLKDIGDSMDLSNIIIARHYSNWNGIFIHQDHLMSPGNSDFQKIHELRPADKVRFLAYNKIMPFINGAAEGSEGGLDSLIADIDNEISGKMEKPGEAEIGGHEIDLIFDDETNEVKGSVGIYKIGTMERISIDIGYQKKE